MPLDPAFEYVAILNTDGEILDFVGKPINVSWAKELAILTNMLGKDLGLQPRSLEIDFNDRKLIILIDPPLIRVGLLRNERR